MSISKFAAVTAASVLTVAAQAATKFEFNSGLDGWGGSGGTPAVSWVASGGVGNSGYLLTVDMAGGQMAASSPSLGNLSYLLNGSFSFSYAALGLQNGNTYVANQPFGLVTFYSGANWVSADMIADIKNDISGAGWLTASRDLSNASWAGNSTLASVLANVTQLTINTEYNQTKIYPDEQVGLDNITFTSAVPEPGTYVLLLAGLGLIAIAARHKRGL